MTALDWRSRVDAHQNWSILYLPLSAHHRSTPSSIFPHLPLPLSLSLCLHTNNKASNLPFFIINPSFFDSSTFLFFLPFSIYTNNKPSNLPFFIIPHFSPSFSTFPLFLLFSFSTNPSTCYSFLVQVTHPLLFDSSTFLLFLRFYFSYLFLSPIMNNKIFLPFSFLFLSFSFSTLLLLARHEQRRILQSILAFLSSFKIADPPFSPPLPTRQPRNYDVLRPRSRFHERRGIGRNGWWNEEGGKAVRSEISARCSKINDSLIRRGWLFRSRE